MYKLQTEVHVILVGREHFLDHGFDFLQGEDRGGERIVGAGPVDLLGVLLDDALNGQFFAAWMGLRPALEASTGTSTQQP